MGNGAGGRYIKLEIGLISRTSDRRKLEKERKHRCKGGPRSAQPLAFRTVQRAIRDPLTSPAIAELQNKE